jgi:hypothetical protein
MLSFRTAMSAGSFVNHSGCLFPGGPPICLIRSAISLSHYVPELHADQGAWREQLKSSAVRVQWDPERDLHLRPLSYRSLQLGLTGDATARYADEWITAIRDVTPLAHQVHALVRAGDLDEAARLLPSQTPYPTPDGLLDRLGALEEPGRPGDPGPARE